MSEPQYKSVNKFDRAKGNLTDLPDVTNTKEATVSHTIPLSGESETFIVQTYRQRECGDTIFLQCIDQVGAIRIVIPPGVAEAIARQRIGGQGPQAAQTQGPSQGLIVECRARPLTAGTSGPASAIFMDGWPDGEASADHAKGTADEVPKNAALADLDDGYAGGDRGAGGAPDRGFAKP